MFRYFCRYFYIHVCLLVAVVCVSLVCGWHLLFSVDRNVKVAFAQVHVLFLASRCTCTCVCSSSMFGLEGSTNWNQLGGNVTEESPTTRIIQDVRYSSNNCWTRDVARHWKRATAVVSTTAQTRQRRSTSEIAGASRHSGPQCCVVSKQPINGKHSGQGVTSNQSAIGCQTNCCWRHKWWSKRGGGRLAIGTEPSQSV